MHQAHNETGGRPPPVEVAGTPKGHKVLRQARRTSAKAKNGKIAFAERRQRSKSFPASLPNLGKGEK